MNDLDLCYAPATDLAGRLARRELSPVDLVRAAIARAESVQRDLNCFAFTDFDAALMQARASEARLHRGEPAGALDGVPVTVKDNLATLGYRMTNGSHAMADFVPTADAIAWGRLKAAGAILLGKTTTPEFAHKVLTDSPKFGVTRNPWSREHTPGGSSGGASAALAAGVGALAVGTDGGGSIRCPASCAGVAGIKATLGRIPFESLPDGISNFAFTGPLARSVDDLALALALMSGPAAADPYTLRLEPMPIPGPRRGTAVRGLAIGYVEQFGSCPVDPAVSRLVGAAVARMAADGARIEPVSEPVFADVFEYYSVLATVNHAARLGKLAESLGERMSASLRASIAQGATYKAAHWQQCSDRRTALFRRVQVLFERFDLLVTATMTAPPKPLDAGGAINTAMYAEWACTLYPFNLTGHPAASIPCGFTDSGLPVGLQLVGPWYGEDRILDVAAWMEAAMPWQGRRPPL